MNHNLEEGAAPAHSPIHISLKAEPVFYLGSFAITNSLLLSCIILGLLGSIAVFGRRKLSLVPGKIQNIFELFLEGILSLMDSVFADRHKSEKYMPFIATVFLFILCSNWFGLLPGVGSIVVHEGAHSTPLLRAPSADLNFTLALAIIAVLSVNILGAAAIGTASRLKTFFNFSDPISFFIGLIELVSEFAKMISFSFRLFGNVFAGEVLLTIVGFLAPYFVPLPFLFLEVFVGFVQALIFSMLSIVFIGIATVDHHGEEHAPRHG